LDFQEQGRQGGREAPYTPEPVQQPLSPSASRAKNAASDLASMAPTRGQKGINLNRVA
jgi:hypothetical protein